MITIMQHDIEKVLHRLDLYISKEPSPCHFNDPAGEEEIAAFEERNNIRLPHSYKRFLSYSNGGMIVDHKLHELMKRSEDKNDLRWNANYIYGLDDLEEAYNQMSSYNFGLPYQRFTAYPFIPFHHSESGEHLVFITLKGDESESAVLDAYHEETPETWGVVASDFAAFLDAYIDGHGHPNLLGELNEGNAYELVEPLLNPPMKQKETAEEVIKKASKILKVHPDRHWQLMLRGIAYRDIGQYKKAHSDMNKAIEMNPGDAFYHFSRGELYREAGKKRPALIDLDIAVKLEANDPLYLSSRASALVSMNKEDAALDDVNKAISINGEFVLAYMIRENIYREMGETLKADADAKRIADLEGTDL